ncbi:unnamed protein product, partial [Amoebophrya sp. A25]
RKQAGKSHEIGTPVKSSFSASGSTGARKGGKEEKKCSSNRLVTHPQDGLKTKYSAASTTSRYSAREHLEQG